jgi:dihydrofolate synthase/folylpolyglutamate synthase
MTALVAAIAFPRIDEDAIKHGLTRVAWPGRLQIIGTSPTIVVDGAHTPESAQALIGAIHDLFPGERVLVVCGIQADKDIPRIAEPLAGIADYVIAAQAHHPRAASTATLAGAFEAAGSRHVDQVADPLDALAAARAQAGPDDVILVTGSLYLVGEILAAMPSHITGAR